MSLALADALQRRDWERERDQLKWERVQNMDLKDAISESNEHDLMCLHDGEGALILRPDGSCELRFFGAPRGKVVPTLVGLATCLENRDWTHALVERTLKTYPEWKDTPWDDAT